MHYVKCEIESKPLIQLIENTARRIYSEGQRGESDRIRVLIQQECDKFLDAQKQDEEKAPFGARAVRAGEPWTESEDEFLKKNLADFLVQCTKKHERSYEAIISRIKQNLQ